MPPDAERDRLALEWLRHAQSNLDLARQPKSARVLWDHLAFEAQQAAEKAIKALLIYRGIEFPHAHDLSQLLMLLDEPGGALPGDLWEAAAVLTPYAVLARYPGLDPPTSEEACRRAVALAERVVRWAEEVLGVHGSELGPR